MIQEKLLVFHPALAPYRIDFFNGLNEEFEAKFYFAHKNVPNQNFDQQKLLSELNFEPNYLTNGLNIANRTIRTGIISIINNFKPDTILVSEFGQVALFVAFYRNLLNKEFKIYTICDDSLHNAKSRKGVRKFARKLVTDKIDGIIFPSKEVSKWFKKNISSHTKTLELPIIHEDKRFRANIKKSLPEANRNIKHYDLIGKKVILYVGRLAEEKNISFLIRAFNKVRSDDSVLVIVGNGPLRNDLESEVTELGIIDKVIFTGRKEGKELYSWYAIGQIFVLPSTHEPFGAVVNEALLAGCQVLVSKFAGASTLIENGNGEVFDPYDQEELKTKLQRRLEKVDCISEDGISDIRANKMPFRFKEMIKTLIQGL
jgi:glycosyltransferase involved in cell wall biosynthesis